jgi:hypothetical protein
MADNQHTVPFDHTIGSLRTANEVTQAAADPVRGVQ